MRRERVVDFRAEQGEIYLPHESTEADRKDQNRGKGTAGVKRRLGIETSAGLSRRTPPLTYPRYRIARHDDAFAAFLTVTRQPDASRRFTHLLPENKGHAN